MKHFATIASAISISLITAYPQEALSNNENNPIANLIAVSGNCVGNFIMHDKLMPTPECEPLLNTRYKNGRIGFYFTTNGHVITFSGIAKQVSTSKDTAVQPIDLTIVADLQKANTEKPVNLISAGTCAFANPYIGKRVFIQCDVETRKGRFSATFETDASEPKTLIKGGKSITQK